MKNLLKIVKSKLKEWIDAPYGRCKKHKAPFETRYETCIPCLRETWAQREKEERLRKDRELKRQTKIVVDTICGRITYRE